MEYLDFFDGSSYSSLFSLMSQPFGLGGNARLVSMRSNASSSGRNQKRTTSKPTLGPRKSTPSAPPITQPHSGTPRPSPVAPSNRTIGDPSPGFVGVRSPGFHPSEPNLQQSSQYQQPSFPAAAPQEPTEEPLPPSPHQSTADTESMGGIPGPEDHDFANELRNQALHINQLNLRLTGQGHQLGRADEQIFMLKLKSIACIISSKNCA